MKARTAGLKTKSAKIRALGAAGYSRSEIADFLGIRYQHARNVLVDAERVAKRSSADTQTYSVSRPSGLAEGARAYEHQPTDDPGVARRVVVGPGGSVTLPTAMLAACGAADGDILLVRVEDDEIRLVTPAATTRKIREMVRSFVPEGVSLVDDLMRERRREAAREQGGA